MLSHQCTELLIAVKMKLAALLLLCGTIGFALAAYTQDKAATMPSMPMTNVDPAAHAALLVAENVGEVSYFDHSFEFF